MYLLSSSHDAAPAISASPTALFRPLRLTLRMKGVIALTALVAYVVLVGLYVGHERVKLLHIVQQLEHVYAGQGLLIRVNASLTHSLVALQEILNADSFVPGYREIEHDTTAFEASLPDIQRNYPVTAPTVRRYKERFETAIASPSRETFIALRDTAQQLSAQIETLEDGAQDRGEMLSRRYRELNASSTVTSTVVNMVGLLFFGVAVTLFFSRLASDIKRLEARAFAVVSGYRGEPLAVCRRDEVGRLMADVNSMQQELARTEREREISLQQHFHHEKMAAVGSLAATVAHEIGNPIQSIFGIAHHIANAARSNRTFDNDSLFAKADLILKQSERIAEIVRQLADLTSPKSATAKLINVNELIQTTCSFIRYDKRFYRIELTTHLDRDLPAVRGVADHLTQVLMNLLINAADAMDGLSGRNPAICISTQQAEREIVISISDNGHGMAPDILAHAFDESFTTKPPGRGRGIGLYLCKRLIEENGGRIRLESTIGSGTVAEVRLPLSDRA